LLSLSLAGLLSLSLAGLLSLSLAGLLAALLGRLRTRALALLHRGKERVRDELFLGGAARHVLALAFDEREAQIVRARAKIDKTIVDASAGQRAELLTREHLKDLLLAGNLLALAVHDAPAQLLVALAERQSRKLAGWWSADGHTKLVIPLWSATPALVRQTKSCVGGVGTAQQVLGRSGAWVGFAGERHRLVRADVATHLTRGIAEDGRAAMARVDLAFGCVALLGELVLRSANLRLVAGQKRTSVRAGIVRVAREVHLLSIPHSIFIGDSCVNIVTRHLQGDVHVSTRWGPLRWHLHALLWHTLHAVLSLGHPLLSSGHSLRSAGHSLLPSRHHGSLSFGAKKIHSSLASLL